MSAHASSPGSAPSPSCSADSFFGGSFRHEAVIFTDHAALIERCVPFVRAGLAQHQPVLVLAGAQTREALMSALGADVARLACCADADRAWRGGHESMLDYDRHLRAVAADGAPLRLVIEPVWLREPTGEEWHRFEAAANHFFANLPYSSLCLHDARQLDTPTLETVYKTHPLVSDASGRRDSPHYVDAADLVPCLEPAWTDVPAVATCVKVVEPRDARAVAAEAALGFGLAARLDDIVLAVDELVANALEVSGAATIEAWTAEATLWLQVRDDGPGGIAATAGYGPPGDENDYGRGLWLARALSDDATLRSDSTGSAVRIAFRLSPASPACVQR